MTTPTDYERLCQENIRRYGEDTWYTELLEGLYTERTHFILELLQNAEDKKARRIRFDLYADRLEVRHDGTPFDEPDVRGICGIGKSTKKGDLTQIGKFGIGFKSVYAFTEAPEIHSGSEHFRIGTYVRPRGIPTREISTEWTTLFVLPFTRTEVVPVVCEREIGERLAKLDVRTMLFLRHIEEILWWREAGGEGCYLRAPATDGAARHVTLVGQNNLSEEEEHWLVFEAPVCEGTTTEPLRIEAAFRLAKDEKSAREEVVRTENAVLTVFFPTHTETHLGFIIQGPYRTTLGRDNIPSDVEWNQRLVNETAALCL